MNGPKEFGKGHTFASILDEVWCDGGNRMEADRELAAYFFNDSEVGGNRNIPTSHFPNMRDEFLRKSLLSVVHRILTTDHETHAELQVVLRDHGRVLRPGRLLARPRVLNGLRTSGKEFLDLNRICIYFIY